GLEGLALLRADERRVLEALALARREGADRVREAGLVEGRAVRIGALRPVLTNVPALLDLQLAEGRRRALIVEDRVGEVRVRDGGQGGVARRLEPRPVRQLRPREVLLLLEIRGIEVVPAPTIRVAVGRHALD